MKYNKIVVVIALIVFMCLPINVFASVDIDQDNSKQFKDISKYGWAKDAINYFGRAGIVKGDGKGNYQPGKNVSREEFAAMLANTFNAESSVKEQTFSDVPTSKWSYKYIESTKEYLTGYYPPQGKPFFDPSGNATREDVAVAVAKLMGLSEDELVNPNILEESFTDADNVSFNIRGLVAVVVEQKIMLGSNKKLRPTDPINRAEVAVLLYKVMKGSVSDANEPLNLEVEIPKTSKTPEVYISGSTLPGAKVKVNGYDAKVNSSGNFEISFNMKKEGQYNVEVIAIKSGRKAIKTGTIKYEETGAILDITKCPTTSDTSSVTIEGNIKEADGSPVLTINGELVSISNFNYSSNIYTFSYYTNLKKGDNEFKFVVKNGNGKETTETKTITYTLPAPILTITQCPETTTTNTINIAGTVKDSTDLFPDVYINNKSVYVEWDGSWSKSITLTEGRNTLTIRATNNNGESTEITKEVVYTSTVSSPELTITQCPATSSQNTITISGTVKDSIDSYPSVYINNELLYVEWDGDWSKTVTLSQGKNTFTIKATNSSGKSTVITKEVVYNVAVAPAASAPVLTITQCPTTSAQNYITISGTVKDSTDYYPSVYINNESLYIDSYGSWSKTLFLSEGRNAFTIKATNSSGQSTEITKEVVYTVAAAPAATAPVLTITRCPATSTQNTIPISGTVKDSVDVWPNDSPMVYINDESVNVTWWDNYSWSKTVTLSEGTNTFIIKAINSSGLSTEITKEVVYTASTPAATVPDDGTTLRSPILTCTQSQIAVTYDNPITLYGTVTDSTDPYPTLTINDESVTVDANGGWSKSITLVQGENTIVVKATNSNGLASTKYFYITYMGSN